MFDPIDTGIKSSLLKLLFNPTAFSDEDGGQLLDQKDEFSRICSQHRIFNWVLRNSVRSSASRKLQDEIRSHVATPARTEGLRALLANSELIRLVKTLGDAGIEIIPLKGAHLANFIYQSLELRPMRDIDFCLVNPDRSLEAFDLLLDAGYLYPKEFEYNLEECLKHKKHLPTLISPSKLYFVELHAALYDSEVFSGKGQRHLDQIRSKGLKQVKSLSGHCVHLMSLEDLFLHIAVHSAKESKFSNGPICFLDLHTVCNQPGFDWSILKEIADEHQQLPSLALVGAVLQEIGAFGNKAPDVELFKLFDRVPEHLRKAALRNTLCDTRLKPKQRRLLGASSWKDKVKLLKQQMLPTASQLQNLYPSEKRHAHRVIRHGRKIVTDMIPKWVEGQKSAQSASGQQDLLDWHAISEFID